MTNDLSQCVPARLRQTNGGPMVEWRPTDGRRFTQPFFEDTVRRMPRHETSVEEAVAWADAHPGLAPRGFVFHVSRCGSTLISQMLAALPENRVIAEPPALDDTLAYPGVRDERRIAWLCAMVSALGQPAAESETHFFIKWDCWLMPHFPLIRRAFPEAPWIFLYREPVEVLVSQLRKPGAWTIPGGADVGPREEYCARLLAGICDAAIENIPAGGALVNYRQLPDVVCPDLPPWFGVSFTPAQCDRMCAAARCDAKTPSLPFSDDGVHKRAAIPEPALAAVERWLRSPYVRLEHLRNTLCGLPGSAAATLPATPAAQLR